MDARNGPARSRGLTQKLPEGSAHIDRNADDLFRRAFEAAGTAFAIVALDGAYQDANRAFIELVVTRCGRGLDLGATDLLCGRVPAEPLTVIQAFATTDGGHHELERRLVTPDGHWRWLRLRLSPICDEAGQPTHLLLEAEDVTERRRQQNALTGLALKDPLTGLGNRAKFDQSVREAALHGGDAALLFVDLDGFKQVNDGHGHAFGDAVLIEVARRLEASLELGCIAGRLGGDEFAILCVESDLERGRRLAARIQDAMAQPIIIGGIRVSVSASIGVASVADRDTTATELLVEADTAMYRAKAQGGNRTAVFSDPEAPRLRLAWAAGVQAPSGT